MMETQKTLKRASESSVFVLSCTKTSGDKSLSFICYNDISGKMHRDNWNGKIPCLKRWISLQKCLWCAIYWWVIHRQVIVIKNYWHVPPSVNLWHHEKQKKLMWYLWFHKAHKVDWKGKIPCLRSSISLQNCSWCANYWQVIFSQA